MTRNETIERLRNTSEAYSSRIADRLGACNVRVVRTDGTTGQDTETRCRLQALYLMLGDETIAGVEYRFNNQWQSV